tara:strand:+ start:1297 stop:2106 length:810 start_codon:yes stop_codon:yes gene_type:complete
MKKVLLVGCGHMGSALLSAWHNNKNLSVSVVDPKTYKKLTKKYNKKISVYKSINKIKNIQKFHAVVFAVKPQIAIKVVNQFKSIKNNKILFISIIAGKKINFFTKNLNSAYPIVRAMPNMPALFGKGMTCLVSNNLSNKNHKSLAGYLFKLVGKIIWLKKELDIDKITAISGSGPAYYFLFVEKLISESTKLGLQQNVVKELVYQTAIGSIYMLTNTNKNAKELKNIIAVKGGTTESAINVFEKNAKFEKIIFQALKAAFNKAKMLGKN